MKSGSPGHAISVKCHYHGADCSVLKTAKSFGANADDRMMSWLYCGPIRVPKRTESTQHKRMFAATWMNDIDMSRANFRHRHDSTVVCEYGSMGVLVKASSFSEAMVLS